MRIGRIAFALVLLALLGIALHSCTGTRDPVVTEKSFSTTYWDLIGTIKADFTVNGWDHEAGDTLDLSYDLKISFASLAKDNIRKDVKGVWVVWAGERLFDSDGRYHTMVNALMSTFLTTTGIPVENNQAMLPSRKMGHFYGTPFDFADYFPFGKGQGADGLHLTGKWSRVLDSTVPEGYYRPTFDIFIDTEENGPKQWGTAPFIGGNNPQIFTSTSFNPKQFLYFTKMMYPKRFLPMIRVGRMNAEPRIPWVLFPEVHVNGNMGVVADEDKDRFGVSSRYRYPNKLIIPPDNYAIHPCFLPNFPLSAGLTDVGGAVLAQDEIPHYFDFKNGRVSVSIITPRGDRRDLGTKRFVGKRMGGPLLEGGDYSFNFSQPGKYVVSMTGWVKDILGRTIQGGGTYQVWVGRWLTFSSTVKPGYNFHIGNSYPAKVEINPPCPADIEITVDYYPNSDKDRKRTVVLGGKANNYGYFFPKEGSPNLVFDEPGEYRAETFAHFRSPDGTAWFGSQTSVGVIVGADSRVALHGMRSSDLGILKVKEPNFGMRERPHIGDESSMGVNFLDVSDCYDVMSPFYSGDTLHISSTLSHFGNVDSYLSMEPKDPALRDELYKKFTPTPLLSLFAGKAAPLLKEKMLRMNMLSDVTYIMRDDEKADMFPILMQNRLNYQPFDFPELNDVETYTYFSSLRPGFSTYSIASDSTAVGSYWSTSPNIYGYQFNAGVNGDMPNDIYLTNASLVYKDKRKGTVDYASYSSTIVVGPKEMNDNRVVAPMEEPLFKVNGVDVWLAIAMGTSEVLEVGDRVSLGLIVFPQVPAAIEETLTWPGGDRGETVKGDANAIGNFPGGVFTLDRAGVYRVKVTADYKGKTGIVFGSGDGVFNHYVVEQDHPDILRIGLPPVSDFDVSKILEIPMRIQDGYTDAKVTYTVLFPGMLMDEGEFAMNSSPRAFRFIPSQFAAQFPNFDATDYLWGTPKMNDSAFFVFFVEAKAPDGRIVHDARKIMIRDKSIYNLNQFSWADLAMGPKGPGGHRPK